MAGEFDGLRVLFDPAPAITGTRPSAASMQSSTTRLCSSWTTVGDSPVVPTGTTPLDPSRICQSTKALSAASSMAPSLIGVTKAGMEPLNMTVSVLPAAVVGGR
jgi:hypothetical protein